MKKIDTIVLGDINLDLIVKDLEKIPEMGEEVFVNDIITCVGGSGANTAVGLAKLGINVAMYGVISDDYYGQMIQKYFKDIGVSIECAEINSDVKSGLSIGFTKSEDRCFISYMGTNGVFALEKFDVTIMDNVRHVHLSGFNWENNMDDYLSIAIEAKNRSCTTSLDIGWTDFSRYKDGIYELLKYIDIFFPNYKEAKELTGYDDIEIIAKELKKSVRTVVVITNGESGAYAYTEYGMMCNKGFNIKSIDAVGAGDSFDAGFISSFLEGKSIEDCLEFGCACGALTTSGYGGSISNPYKKDVNAFIKAKVV